MKKLLQIFFLYLSISMGCAFAQHVVIGCIGDSLTYGTGSSPQVDPCTIMVSDLNTMTDTSDYTSVNEGVTGSTTAEWVSGSTNLTNALAAFSSGHVSVVYIMLGTNDSNTINNTPASTWLSNMQNLAATLETNGYTNIFINYQPYINSNADDFNITTSNALLNDYQADYVTMAMDDPDVHVGDTTAWAYFEAHLGDYYTDNIHLNNTGYMSLGQFWATAFYDQTIIISNISTGSAGQDLEHGSVRVSALISVNAYAQIRCGMATGGPYTTISSASYKTGQNNDSGYVLISLGALQDGTPYFCVAAGRPDPNDQTGERISDEFTFTTLTTPNYPVFPNPPTPYEPTFPDTSSGYTRIPVSIVSPYTECVATSAVAPVTYGMTTWQVHLHDTLTQILQEIGYGAIIDIAQGTTCPVPNNLTYNGGYILGSGSDNTLLTVDPNASGVNDPTHRWVIIETDPTTNPDNLPPFGFQTGPSWEPFLANLQASAGSGGCCAAGQIFDTTHNTGATHHFWLSDLELSVNPSVTGNVGAMMQWGNPTGNSYNRLTPPDYLVAERLDIETPTNFPTTYAVRVIWGGPGDHWMEQSNWVGPVYNPAGFAQVFYTSDCTGGPFSITNNLLQSGGQLLYFESNAGSQCYGSTAGVSPTDGLIARNTLYNPLTTVDGQPGFDGISRFWRNPVESKRWKRVNFYGNRIDGCISYQNEGSCIEISGNEDANPSGVTGIIDTTISNNWMRHAAYLIGCGGGHNVDNGQGLPDASTTRRILIYGNLGTEIGSLYKSTADMSQTLYTGYSSSYNGCQDAVYLQNTFGLVSAYYASEPAFFWPTIFLVGGGQFGAEGFYFNQNLIYFSGGPDAGQDGIWASNPTGCCTSSFAQNFPQPITSGTYDAIQKSFFTTVGATTISTGDFLNNVIVCGNDGSGWSSPMTSWPDMSQTNCNTRKSQWPSGNIWPTGTTIAARETNAGLINHLTNTDDYTVTPTAQNPGLAGANLNNLEAALGVISQINCTANPTSVSCSYLASDAKAVSIDLQISGTWTRNTDSGGARFRTQTITGLTANTCYPYRILDYYSQTATWFTIPWDHSNLTTEGTICTTTSGTHSLIFPITMPSNAVSVIANVTPIGGSLLTNTCNIAASNKGYCPVTSVPLGAYTLQLNYYSGTNGSGTKVNSFTTLNPK